MKWSEIQSMSREAAEKALQEQRAQLVDARFKASAGALKQVHTINVMRKTIARLLTKLATQETETKETKE